MLEVMGEEERTLEQSFDPSDVSEDSSLEEYVADAEQFLIDFFPNPVVPLPSTRWTPPSRNRHDPVIAMALPEPTLPARMPSELSQTLDSDVSCLATLNPGSCWALLLEGADDCTDDEDEHDDTTTQALEKLFPDIKHRRSSSPAPSQLHSSVEPQLLTPPPSPDISILSPILSPEQQTQNHQTSTCTSLPSAPSTLLSHRVGYKRLASEAGLVLPATTRRHCASPVPSTSSSVGDDDDDDDVDEDGSVRSESDIIADLIDQDMSSDCCSQYYDESDSEDVSINLLIAQHRP